MLVNLEHENWKVTSNKKCTSCVWVMGVFGFTDLIAFFIEKKALVLIDWDLAYVKHFKL